MFLTEVDSSSDVVGTSGYGPGAAFGYDTNRTGSFVGFHLALAPAWHRTNFRFSASSLASTPTLISGILITHETRVEPDRVAEFYGTDPVFLAVVEEDLTGLSQNPLGIEAVIAPSLSLGCSDNLVREDGSENVEVDGDWEVPLIDHARMHEEVGDHTHHLLLESVEPCFASVLDSIAGCFVGVDAREECAGIATPHISKAPGVLQPTIACVSNVEVEPGFAENVYQHLLAQSIYLLRKEDIRMSVIDFREVVGGGVALDATTHPVAEGEEEECMFSATPDEHRRDVLFDLRWYGLWLVEGVEFLDIGLM